MNHNGIRLADGYTVCLFESPYLYVNTGEAIEKWVLRKPGKGGSEFEFCSSVGVTKCPPALVEGGEHSYLTRKQVMMERRAFANRSSYR